MVTDKTGRTWPTGGGSICTGTFFSTAFAVNTGIAAPPLAGLLREQPAKTSTAKNIGRRRFFFTGGSFHRFHGTGFLRAGFRRIEGHGKFFEKFHVFTLKPQVAGRSACLLYTSDAADDLLCVD